MGLSAKSSIIMQLLTIVALALQLQSISNFRRLISLLTTNLSWQLADNIRYDSIVSKLKIVKLYSNNQ